MSLPKVLGAALLAAAVVCSVRGLADDASSHAGGGEGIHVFKTANCVGCHKWTGAGGGGYGGAAANLRQTGLDRDQIIETIRCGRPMTGMPHFVPNAYADGSCYGIKKADLSPEQMPPEPPRYLRPEEIDAVADYVIHHIKGKGEPSFAECQAFFGTTSRVCDGYAAAGASPGEAREVSGSDAPPQSRRLQIESAPDANAPPAK